MVMRKKGCRFALRQQKLSQQGRDLGDDRADKAWGDLNVEGGLGGQGKVSNWGRKRVEPAAGVACQGRNSGC